MSFVAAAVSTVVGAGASIIAGNKAAKAQQKATKANIALQQEQDAEAKRRYELERADLAPYREAGTKALGQLVTGTAPGGEYMRDFTLKDFQREPGYEFRRAEGQRGVENSAAARGGILSGGTLKALTRYNEDYASNEYGKAYDRYNNNLTTRFNRLSALAGTGQTATNATNQASQNLTGTLQTGVNNNTSQNNAAANARSSSYAGTANAVSGAVNQVGQYFALRDLYGSGGGGATGTGTPMNLSGL